MTVRGTALFAVLFFALGWPGRPNALDPLRNRLYWLGGWAVCVGHVLIAYDLAHGWSHDRAVEATAKQTADLVGFSFGGGVWINYGFLALWGADAAWRILLPSPYWMRSTALHWTILSSLAFIVFNATIVFGGWPGRIVGIIAMLAIAARRPKACST
ncbi:MAG: hypothetical protein U0744_09315 [Gemmataceae bacterium]